LNHWSDRPIAYSCFVITETDLVAVCADSHFIWRRDYFLCFWRGALYL